MSDARDADDAVAVAALGDSAVLLTLGDRVDLALNRRVHRVAAAVRARAIPAVTDVVPAYAALSVHYDPLHVEHDAIAAELRAIARDALLSGADAADRDATTHEIPVAYDGPDLAEVAERTGLRAEDVIALHAGATYTVYLLGFVPGFAYLGELDPALVLERRPEPRMRVLAGSVGIAGRQTAVYPLPTPGGWHLIGRTEVRFFDPAADPPALLAAGDRVRFVPVAP